MSVPMPSRRGLLAASAWTVPTVIVATAAPAYASSPASQTCVPATYVASWTPARWTYHARSRTGSLVAHPRSPLGPAAGSAEPLVITVTHSFTGKMRAASASDGATNMEVSPFVVGRTGARGLTMMQRLSDGQPTSTGRRQSAQVMTLTFNRPVRGLRFTVTDIDSAANQYRDRVELSGAPRVALPDTLTGRGTQGDPLRNRSDNALYDPSTDGRGNAVVTYETEVQQVRVTFWNDHPPRSRGTRLIADGQQGIFLSELSFTASTC